MAHRRVRTFALATAVLGCVVTAGLLFASRHVLLERWSLHQLESADPDLRQAALERLAAVGTHRSIAPLIQLTRDDAGEREVALRALEGIAPRTTRRYRREIVRGLLDVAHLEPFFFRMSDGTGNVTWVLHVSTRYGNQVVTTSNQGSEPDPSIASLLARWVSEFPAAGEVLLEALAGGDEGEKFTISCILLDGWPGSKATIRRFLGSATPEEVVGFFRPAMGAISTSQLPLVVNLASNQGKGTPMYRLLTNQQKGTLTFWPLAASGSWRRSFEVAVHFARHHESDKVRAIALSFAAAAPRKEFLALLGDLAAGDRSPLVREVAARLRVVTRTRSAWDRTGLPEGILIDPSFQAFPQTGPSGTATRQSTFELWDGFPCDWLPPIDRTTLLPAGLTR